MTIEGNVLMLTDHQKTKLDWLNKEVGLIKVGTVESIVSKEEGKSEIDLKFDQLLPEIKKQAVAKGASVVQYSQVIKKENHLSLTGTAYAIPDTLEAYVIGSSFNTYIDPGYLGQVMKELPLEDPDRVFGGHTEIPHNVSAREAMGYFSNKDLKIKYQAEAQPVEEKIKEFVATGNTLSDCPELTATRTALWNITENYVSDLKKRMDRR
jgi:hypothetical protein